MSKRAFSATPMFLALICFATPLSQADASISLEWRPDEVTVPIGQTAELSLFAVSDDDTDQPFSVLYAVLNWEPDYLGLLGNVDNGPYQWIYSGFPDDSTGDGYNNTWLDGDALYMAWRQFGEDAEIPAATPEGLEISTFLFDALALTSGTELTIFESDMDGNLGSAWITVIPEPATLLLVGVGIAVRRGSARPGFCNALVHR